MKLKKKALLYDIENIAYVIADNHKADDTSIHRVRDICREGNIDRVARVLGLAYSQILVALSPITVSLPINENHDLSLHPHDYEINFRTDGDFKNLLTPEIKLKIKETAHEYMVAMVLDDWLAITFPVAADVWKYKAETSFESLKDITCSFSSFSTYGFRRKLSPF